MPIDLVWRDSWLGCGLTVAVVDAAIVVAIVATGLLRSNCRLGSCLAIAIVHAAAVIVITRLLLLGGRNSRLSRSFAIAVVDAAAAAAIVTGLLHLRRHDGGFGCGLSVAVVDAAVLDVFNVRIVVFVWIDGWLGQTIVL